MLQTGPPGIFGDPEGGDIFGAALTTGNFDGDGFADIAIGVPGEARRGHGRGRRHERAVRVDHWADRHGQPVLEPGHERHRGGGRGGGLLRQRALGPRRLRAG